jgi:excisionase family DNA binding protein
MAGKLERVSWLAEYLNTTQAAAYYLISSGRLPAHCVVRLGPQMIRVDSDAVREWIESGGFEADTAPAEAVR